jgi:hypothetical protein
MNTASMVSIRAGIAAARADFGTLYGFYDGTLSLDLLDDFLSLADLFEDALTGQAWSRTMLHKIYRLESLFV